MNILLTSVGRRSYLVEYLKKALAGAGEVHISNSSNITPAFLCADHSTMTPLIYSDEYIPFLLDYCEKHSINAIIPLLDMDLPMLAQHRKEFTDIGTTLIVSDIDVIRTCNDKWVAYQFLRENGFNTPQTWFDLAGCEEACFTETATFPLIIKPRWGMGSLNVYEAENQQELRVFYQKAKREVVHSPMLKYEAAQDKKRCVIIQEKLEGQEYGLDIINDLNRVYQGTIVKKKLAMRAGETDCAQIVDTPELKALGEDLGNKLGHIANLDVDVFLSNGKPYILEMNARFGGGYPFSHVAGVDLPQAIIKWLRGQTPDAELFEPKIGLLAHKDIAVRVLK